MNMHSTHSRYQRNRLPSPWWFKAYMLAGALAWWLGGYVLHRMFEVVR